MFGKCLMGFLMAPILGGCADPKYVQRAGLGGDSGQEKATACLAKFSNQKCVFLKWEIPPTEKNFGTFVFKTFRPNLLDGTAVVEDLPATLEVILWMPSMGHGSTPVTVERIDVGTYRASQVYFTMRGQWEIRFQLKDKNAVGDQAIIDISF